MKGSARILMTVDSVGGVWQYACELSSALLPLGIHTTLAHLGPAPCKTQRRELADSMTLIETGASLDWLSPNPSAVRSAAEAIAALAETECVDLVHLNQPALAAVVDFPVPVLTAIHSCTATWWQANNHAPLAAELCWQKDLVSQGLRRADAVVAPSQAFADVVRQTYVLPKRPVVVRNGRTPPRTTHCAVEDYAFASGRLWDEAKNVALLDRVAARLDCPLKAAGSMLGPSGETVVLEHIDALGFLDEPALAALLSPRPVFVSSALYEPFGLSVLEAAYAGCPLVLSDIPSFRENWNGVAVFVDPLDELGFVDAIESILADGDMRARQGELARQRAQQFTPARMAKAMKGLYSRLIETSGADMRIIAA